MSVLGPNTHAPLDCLSPRCILIAGEDRHHVLPLLSSPSDPSFAFRGYEFWKQRDFTVILCGIGTGCLEPLIWELTRPRTVHQIILIGTADKMPRSTIQSGQPYAIREASPAGTGLDGEVGPAPLVPRWVLPDHLPTATSVSTDFFYGFSPRLHSGEYPFQNGALQRKFEIHLKMKTDLVEMEVAPFYAFCEAFAPRELNYLAIKGASNDVGNDQRQVIDSPAVIQRCMDLAKQLIR